MSPEHDLRCISKFLFTLGLLFKVTFYSKGNLPIVFFIYNSRDYGFIRSAHGGIKKGIGSLHPAIKEELRVIMLFSSL